MKLLLPKGLMRIDKDYGPLFFLAGPHGGEGQWQAEVCRMLCEYVPHFYVAVPYDYPVDHPLMRYHMRYSEHYFGSEVSWTRHYQNLAGNADDVENRGCIIFWFPHEGASLATDEHLGFDGWSERAKRQPSVRVVAGGTPDRYGLATQLPLHASLRATVEAGIKMSAYT